MIRYIKRSLASILIITLVVSLFSNITDTSVVVRAEEKAMVEDNYTYLSFHDYRVEGINAIAEEDWTEIPDNVSSSFHAIAPNVEILDHVIFQGNITFKADNQSFGIGSTRQATDGTSSDMTDYGLRFYVKGTDLYARNCYTPNATDVRICSVSFSTPTSFWLEFEQASPGNWKVAYKINSAEGELSYKNEYTNGKLYDFGPQLYCMPGNVASMSLSSVNGGNPAQILKPVSYDLSDGDYLVSGTAEVVNSDGVIVLTTPCKNPTIQSAGDYTITTMVGSFSKQQKVSLFKVGDLNFDGSCDANDYWKLVDLLQYVNNNGAESYVRPYKADSAAEYAADLNNNGKVDRDDLDLIYSIVSLKTTTLEDVIKKYHVPAVSYDVLGGRDVMPIVGYYGPYVGPLGQKGYDFLTDDIYQTIQALGINVITDSPNQLGNNTGTRYVYRQLQLAEKYAIGQLVHDMSLNPELEKDANGKSIEVADTDGPSIQELAEQIGKYSYFGSYLGTYVRDEPYFYYPNKDNPTAAEIAANNMQLKYFDWIAKKMNQFTNNLGFVNAVGGASEAIYATSYEVGIKNFRDGLEEIYNRTNAKIFSHTSYPFSYGSSLDNVSHTGDCRHDKLIYVDGVVCPAQCWQHYYKDLWDSMEVAKEKNGTFWAYTAAGGDFRDGAETGQTNSEKLPTEQETYWDINQKLAFGAKGIEYFPLLQPWYFVQDETQPEGYDYNRCGLINLKGELTTYGEYALQINRHIQAIDDVLMRSSSKGIIATGSTTKARVTSDGDSLLSNGTVKLASVSGDVTSGYGALVGCFDYGDTEAFYVVNYSLNTSQSFTLNFRNSYNYRCVSEAVSYTGSGKTLTLSNIKPGRGVLVVLDEKDIRYTDEANKAFNVHMTNLIGSDKNIVLGSGSTESLYGSRTKDNIQFAYDTDAVFLNGQAIQPKIMETNTEGVWGYELDLGNVALSEGDMLYMQGTIYPTTGEQKGRLTDVVSDVYVWTGEEWSQSGYCTVSLYKGTQDTEKYPTREGKVFAGWFTDETCKTVYEENEGIAYAKFVDEGVLAYLAQIPVETKYDTKETKMRFVSTVDSLDYYQVGFTIEVEGSTKGPKDVTSKYVYKKIVTNEGGVSYNKSPKDIHKDSEYFFTYTLEDITNDLFSTKIYVTPFWVTLDGTKVCGERKAKTVHMGIQAIAGENNNYEDDDVVNGGVDDDETNSGGFIEGKDPEDGYGPIS